MILGFDWAWLDSAGLSSRLWLDSSVLHKSHFGASSAAN